MESDAASIGPRGPYAKSAIRRAEILDQAIELISQRGTSGTSLRTIAASLGVTHAALQYYFDSRENLLLEVLDTGEARAAAAQPRRDGGAIERMRQNTRRNESISGLVQLYLGLAARALESEGPVRDHIVSRFEKIRHDIARQVEADKSAGLVPADVEPTALASLIIAAADGLQLQAMLDPTVDRDASLALLERLLRGRDARAGDHD